MFNDSDARKNNHDFYAGVVGFLLSGLVLQITVGVVGLPILLTFNNGCGPTFC
jgi:hypothetical protein